MQDILSAMQEDANVGRQMAKASHELAQEMKRDSVAMRTVCFKCPHKLFMANKYSVEDRYCYNVLSAWGNLRCKFYPYGQPSYL